MNKIKLAHFDDSKWTYKQLCKYALKYRKLLANKVARHRQRDELTEAIEANHAYEAFRRYNSIPRYLLIKRLKEAQNLLYK